MLYYYILLYYILLFCIIYFFSILLFCIISLHLSYHIMSNRPLLYHVIWFHTHIKWYYRMFNHTIVSFLVVKYWIKLYHVIFSYFIIILDYIILCCIISYYIVWYIRFRYHVSERAWTRCLRRPRCFRSCKSRRAGNLSVELVRVGHLEAKCAGWRIGS